jgi:L-galactose dehydrogenase
MQFTTLGRTGLKVSVIGLGTGGPSRLGLAKGRPVHGIVKLVRHALDRGINFIDLGATYGTDMIVAEAIGGRRHDVVISAKTILGPPLWIFEGTRTASRISARLSETASFVTSGPVIEQRLEATLRRLHTDYIDVFSLHSVTPAQYEAAADRLLASLMKLREQGKVRAIGISEAYKHDPGHVMLARAAAVGRFDMIMIAFNLLNRTGAGVAIEARRHGTGVVAMYALRPLFNRVKTDAAISASDDMAALTPLLKDYGISSLEEAAMRFCRHQSGADVVLSGTGCIEHLDANISAALAGPLPDTLTAQFGPTATG